MWELWTCDVPFKDMREQSVVWGIMTGKRPELPPADLDEPCVGWRDLMTALWREDPKSRPTFDETARVLEEALTETNAGRSGGAEIAGGERSGATIHLDRKGTRLVRGDLSL